MTPTQAYVDATWPNDPQNITFRRNIVYDTALSYSHERATVVIGPYMSDQLYDVVTPQLHFDYNCYFNNSQAVQFTIGSLPGSSYGSKGGDYSFVQWQNLGGYGYDAHSLVTDPQFVNLAGGDFHVTTGSPCANMGAYAP
jgi:hypothetical protein